MVNLKVVVQKTPVKIHRNSLRCRARITSATMNADGFGVFHLFKGRVIDPTTTRTPYPQIVKMYTDRRGNIPDNPKIFCWCGCAWFKYNCEVALAIRGSSAIISTNGALPKITNPTSRPQVCKHMLTFLKACWRAKERIDTNKSQAADQGLNRLESVVNRKGRPATKQTKDALNQLQHPEATPRAQTKQQQKTQPRQATPAPRTQAPQRPQVAQQKGQAPAPVQTQRPVSGVINTRTGTQTGGRPAAQPMRPTPATQPVRTTPTANQAGRAGQAGQAGRSGQAVRPGSQQGGLSSGNQQHDVNL